MTVASGRYREGLGGDGRRQFAGPGQGLDNEARASLLHQADRFVIQDRAVFDGRDVPSMRDPARIAVSGSDCGTAMASGRLHIKKRRASTERVLSVR
jgi:hypothetical protein